MRLADNTRAFLSTTIGWAGGGLPLAGWAAKAVTPSSASFASKASIGTATAAVVAATSFGLLHFVAPSNISISDIEITLYNTATSQGLAATYAGICTALSYALGGANGDGTKPKEKRKSFNLR